MENIYAKYKAVLNSELEAIIEAEAAQLIVSEAVKRRDWIDFNASIEVVNSLISRFAALEQERMALTPEGEAPTEKHDSALNSGLSFYAFAQCFPVEERRELCDLYRRMKFEAAKLRFSAAALANYLGESRLLVSGLLAAAFPEKRGKIYGKSGAERSADLGGIVLNRRF
ncbi:MAG: hypothetical protein LBK66_01545 [Spirochaetaceae bacterium]|jgi:hypothetical protein|nr:hypothetical protein [Spirochaetaceae bacterium]